MLTHEEFVEATQKIISAIPAESNDGEVSKILTSLTEGFTETITDKEKLAKDNDELKARNEKLRDANMELYLKVGMEKEDRKIEVQPERQPIDMNATLANYI